MSCPRWQRPLPSIGKEKSRILNSTWRCVAWTDTSPSVKCLNNSSWHEQRVCQLFSVCFGAMTLSATGPKRNLVISGFLTRTLLTKHLSQLYAL